MSESFPSPEPEYPFDVPEGTHDGPPTEAELDNPGQAHYRFVRDSEGNITGVKQRRFQIPEWLDESLPAGVPMDTALNDLA